MNKLLFFVLIGISFSVQAQIYELYRKIGLLTQLMDGGDEILLSNQTGEKGTWGPTKKILRSQGADKKLAKNSSELFKIQNANGSYIVLLGNNKTKQPKAKKGEQFMWVSMKHIQPVVQQGTYQKIMGENGAPQFSLDKSFFDALVNDSKNPEGFVNNSVTFPSGPAGASLNYSSAT